MNRKLGKFSISRIFIEDWSEHVLLVMAECIIVRAELRYDIDCFEYTAISKRFEEVLQGNEPPTYDVVFKDDEFRFKKKTP